MTITTFRRTYVGNAVSVPIDKIFLTEEIHKENKEVGNLNSEPMCVVRKTDEGTYSLVIGYRDYMIAKRNGAEFIKAIIVPDKSRDDFLHSLNITPELWLVSSIHEPKSWTYPSVDKVRDCQRNFNETGTFNKSVVITPTGKILDGYSAVCAARLLGVNKIPVYVINESHWKKSRKIIKKGVDKNS